MAAEKKGSKAGRKEAGGTDAIQAAIEYGIDVSMLAENLARSCTERVMRHQVALDTAERLRKARRL
jgi:hypothetical protein